MISPDDDTNQAALATETNELVQVASEPDQKQEKPEEDQQDAINEAINEEVNEAAPDKKQEEELNFDDM
jgi:hypothetical protein